MVVELIHHIELVSENPLDAQLAGRNTKAYIIAQYALASSVEITARDYSMTEGAVYAALSFYADNREAIQQALEEVRAIDLGDMEVPQERIEEIRQKLAEIKKNEANQQKPE